MGAIGFYLLMLQKYIKNTRKKNPLRLEIFQEIFQPITWKKAGLNGCTYDFSIDYRSFDPSNVIDIHKYLIKRYKIK